jgi:hypothetical protein
MIIGYREAIVKRRGRRALVSLALQSLQRESIPQSSTLLAGGKPACALSLAGRR